MLCVVCCAICVGVWAVGRGPPRTENPRHPPHIGRLAIAVNACPEKKLSMRCASGRTNATAHCIMRRERLAPSA
eukprot:scaffold1991_cov111-Isochrysis_galbana.AAC.8